MKNILTLCFILTPFIVCAQSNINLKDEGFLKNELGKNHYDIDSNAKAIILFEEGRVDFENGSYDYKYEIIAKLLSDDAVEDLAEVVIAKRDNTNITSISAESFNLDNGQIVKSKLESENILKDKIDKDLKVIKFNIPNVKKGSIIHYTYKLHKSEVISIPEWPFQNLYPTLYSKYSLKLPNTISFNKILRSGKRFTETNREKELETCEACEYSEKYEGTGTYIAWASKDIPAFQKEPFSSGKDNFMERIKVIITSLFLSDGTRVKIFNNWPDFSKKYLYDNEMYIGQVFKANNFLDDIVTDITKNAKTNLEKAQAIFSYVRLNINYIDNDDDNIKSVYKNKKGSVYGINMLLVAMMKNANLDCDPVVLSTKSNERLNELYPSPYDLNYLVGYFNDKDKEYFLDATESSLPFGVLKPQCYNGYARVVNKAGGAVTLSPDEIRDKTTTVINIEPSVDNTSLIIKADKKLGTFSGIDFRNNTKGNSSDAKNNLIQSITDNSVSIIPESITFKNFDDPDQPLSIHYEATIKLDTATALFYMNPYFIKFYNKNPFTSVARTLPIELEYNEEETYILNLKLPKDYQIDDYPKSATIKLREDGSMFFSNIFNYDEERKTFNIVSKFQTKTTMYHADEYQDIRAFFERMIEDQNKKIVLTKSR